MSEPASNSAGRATLLERAREASARAHAPYSGIHVGAALRSAAGQVYCGSNVENAAYPLGNCAEASAIAAGVQAEGPGFRIREIAVFAADRGGRTIAAAPCGGCRQRIHELADGGGTMVHFPWRGGETKSARIDELLPHAFVLPAARSP